MAYYYPGASHHQTATASRSPASHSHHGGRSRRAPRLSSAQSHKPFRGVRSMKELAESPSVAAFRTRFEAGRSFDLDDDWEFCPSLMTEDDLQTMSSSSSDRSSMSSGSPETSPLQQQAQPAPQFTPSFTNPPSNHTFNAAAFGATSQMKLHQPHALRPRNAIPIINPATRQSSSPPHSISPGRLGMGRRW